jgi:protoporphyrinogen oxidase
MEIAVLGAGLSGLALADKLSQESGYTLTVVDLESTVGGMCRSHEHHNVICDLGSHRLHPGTPPEIVNDIRSMIGRDLLLRRRNGLLYLRGKKVQFPLKPWDAFVGLRPTFVGRLLGDMLRARTRAVLARKESGNFQEFLESRLGPTLCRAFYFPYAQKLWGLPPVKLSHIQARRRVPNRRLARIAWNAVRRQSVPGRSGFDRSARLPSDRWFYYPRKGIGQMADALRERLTNRGVTFNLGAEVTGLSRDNGKITGVELTGPGGKITLSPDWVFSSLAVTEVVDLFNPPLPDDVLQAASSLGFRGMVLVYLEMDIPQHSPWDAHYFPEDGILCSRMSEPKNYSGNQKPPDRTILCVEVPCEVGDSTWNEQPEHLGMRIADVFEELDMLVAPFKDVFVKKLPHAYPVYKTDYQQHLTPVLECLDSLANFVTFGRQGLFWYANMHHVIQAAQELASCFRFGGFSHPRWRDIRHRMDRITVAD